MNLAAIAVFAGALAPIMPVGAVLLVAFLLVVTLFAMFRPRRPRLSSGTFVGRHRTRDISILAQSATVIIGRITRSVPAPKILPGVNDGTNPVSYFGLAVLRTTSNTIRGILASDAGATKIDGIAVQPFPFQVSSGTNYGAQSMSTLTAVPAGVLDVNYSGPIGVYVNSSQAPSVTGADPVFVWCAATSGNHVQGGFENAPSAAIVATAKVGNTGNGTVSAGPTVNGNTAINGNYTVNFTAATAFNVYDPNGRLLEPGVTGTAYSDGGIGFTITAGGTAFVAGDQFTMAVTFSTIPVANARFSGPGDSTGATELLFNL